MKNAACRLLMAAALTLAATAVSAAPGDDLGRLFYTPSERAQLELARARHAAPRSTGVRAESTAPLRYDGAVIRSDGRSTHWVDGRAQPHAAEAGSLKPGQTRADGQVLEPYQVLRPAPAPAVKESAP
ncbi:MAG: hypothetical protein ACLGG6_02260 [Gammaproteobacteria bacterium]